MPTHIGDFISTHVYDEQLKSSHSIIGPECCRFVDIAKGVEISEGRSWKNLHEVEVAITIARRFTKEKKSFRIITPYNPQRNLLEKGLTKAGLPWKDKCFNIDAFQGNEDDYIVISLVRSAKLGFMKEMRRTNVMLTRCKKAMIICTSRKFIEGPAADSLVGKLSRSLPDSAWTKGEEVKGARLFV
ncbi:hypothetical protein BDN70DRAFT_676483 [Pholiota conissans]|uniref:DNA2/NAM7 helicase-like C-terminal domain-containing protein n=1 Tax=Pholiota conissans TaxID=109636 RepID=A0A9P5ZDU3_9AGAR|nr:hypothetical protein BDN70DRAFT_676483 [Pholiota conissans]